MDEKQKNIQEKQQEIINLQAHLASKNSEIGDYKIIKCYEAALLGKKDMPYDAKTLIAERQKVRDKINALQEEIKTLEAEIQAE